MPNDSARSRSTLIALKVASEKFAATMLKEYVFLQNFLNFDINLKRNIA